MSPYFKACAQLASGSHSKLAMHCLASSLQGLHWFVITKHVNSGAWRCTGDVDASAVLKSDFWIVLHRAIRHRHVCVCQ